MVAFGRLGHAGLVGLQILLAGPRSAIHTLQSGVALVTTPIGCTGLGECEGLKVARVRHVRPAAQITPGNGAVAADVVIDGELSLPHLDGRSVSRRGAPFVRDQLEFEGLISQFTSRLLITDLPSHETLLLADDLPHLFLHRFEVLRRERGGREVVVETIGDRRPDTKFRLSEQMLQCLRGHVSSGVTNDAQPLIAACQDRGDLVAVAELTLQVQDLPVDAHGNHGTIAAEQIEPGSGGRHQFHALAGAGTDNDDRRRHGGPSFP